MPGPSRDDEAAQAQFPRGRHTASGSLKVLAAEALVLPVGIAISAFLTRQLGPERYGLYSVALAVSFWFELVTSLVFSRTVVKFVAEASDWKPIASAAVRAQFVVGVAGAALLVAMAFPLARWLQSPELPALLCLLAAGVPLFAMMRVHSLVLVARGAFGHYAITTASRFVTRLLLTVAFVLMGLSTTGAVLAHVSGLLIALATVRIFVRPPLLRRPDFPTRQLLGYALPLFVASISIHLFSRLDLLAVQALSGSSEAAGLYGAAQGITVVPGLLSGSVAPVIMATVSRLSQERRSGDVRVLIEQVLRLEWMLIPLGGLVAGTGSAVASLIYGDAFRPAGPLIAILMFAGLALTMISFSGAILTAVGRPRLVLALNGPLAPLALVAHLVVLPRFGPIGAATVTAVLAWLAAGASLAIVGWQTGAYPRLSLMFRVLVTTCTAYGLALMWGAGGIWVVVELGVLTIVVLGCLWLLGEVTPEDLRLARSLFSARPSAATR